jgi:hypothetical protein
VCRDPWFEQSPPPMGAAAQVVECCVVRSTVGQRSAEVVVGVGVREDLDRLRSAIDEAQREVGLWFDRLVAGTVSPAEFEDGSRQPSQRLDRFERELARLRSDPGDMSVADLDVLIEDVELSRVEAIRRLELLDQPLRSPDADPVTRAIVGGEIAGLEGVLASLRARREERVRFADRAMRYLSRAVEDGVLDEELRYRLRTYLE